MNSPVKSEKRCPNCGRVLTCSCQKRVSKNNIACCTSCVAQVNNMADRKRTFLP